MRGSGGPSPEPDCCFARVAEARLGIEAGYATLGRIGFEGRFDYGALGPATNLAARLCSHASSGQTLIGQRVFAATEEGVERAHVGSLELKGFGRPVVAYEVRRLRQPPA